MSTLSVDTIQGQTTAANVKLPAGSIIQTVTFTSHLMVLKFQLPQTHMFHLVQRV